MSDGAGHLDRDEQPVGRLYREHAGWLLARLRRRFGDRAEDLVQEAYLRLAVARVEARHPKALLLKVATNLALNQARATTRHQAAVEALAGKLDFWRADQIEALLLKQVILGMPKPLRDVFILARFDWLTSAQIASRLEIAPKTVEWRMTKALAYCAAKLRTD